MKFVTFAEVAERFRGKSVAIVGSAPSVLDNAPGFVDSHDVVLRVNNYRTSKQAGYRCDVHFSFYGNSIRKTAAELQHDGVKLVMCKCPDAKPIECEWHERSGRQLGIDFRYIFKARASYWFCDTFIPSSEHFLRGFNLLGRHIPTTGFSAILDVLACEPASVLLTGFDGFTSGLHNVNEPWRAKNIDDPIRHRPELEFAWLRENADKYPLVFDGKLAEMMREEIAA